MIDMIIETAGWFLFATAMTLGVLELLWLLLERRDPDE